MNGGIPARAVAIAVAAGLAGGSLAPAAQAAGTKTARFIASVKATYTTNGTVDAQCAREGPNGEIVYVTMTGSAGEQASLKTTKAQKIEVSKTRGFKLAAGAFKLLKVAVGVTRSGNLGSPFEPRGCDLRGFDPPPDCGGRNRRYEVNIYGTGSGSRAALGFRFIRSRFFVWQPGPDDPYNGCPLPASARWFGHMHLKTPPARVSESRLFNRRVGKIVISAALSGHPKESGSQFSAQSAFNLRYTLTLKRTT